MRYQRISPADTVPLSNGKRSNSTSMWKTTKKEEDDNSHRVEINGVGVTATNKTNPCFEGVKGGLPSRFRSPSMTAQDYQPNNNGTTIGGEVPNSPPANSNTSSIPSSSRINHNQQVMGWLESSSNGVSGGDRLLLQWGHRKRSRCSRSGVVMALTDDSSSSSSATHFQHPTTKLPRRSSLPIPLPLPSHSVMAPPPSLPSSSTNGNDCAATRPNVKSSSTRKDSSAASPSRRNLEERSGGGVAGSKSPRNNHSGGGGGCSSNRAVSSSSSRSRVRKKSPPVNKKAASASGSGSASAPASGREEKMMNARSSLQQQQQQRQESANFNTSSRSKQAAVASSSVINEDYNNNFNFNINSTTIGKIGGVGTENFMNNNNNGGGEGNEWPRIYIPLSRKEKEEDFLAMKGTKLPHRPKKRPKAVDRVLQYCFPGMWLSDLTRSRYEVREKKCAKKHKRRGLKGMESMESDSDL